MIRLPHYPALGSKVEFRSADILPGGQVATAVAACQHWGLRTRYVGKIGDDHAAAIHRAEFERLALKLTSSPPRDVPVSKPSSSSTTPASVPFCGNVTTG